MQLLQAGLLLSCALLTVHAADVVCGAGRTKKVVTLKAGESANFYTSAPGTDYKKNVKCQAVFKRAKKNKCQLNFSCEAFALTAANAKCKGRSDFFTVSTVKKTRFCKATPDTSTKKGKLTVNFISNKRSKGGAGAVCTATCLAPGATTPAPPATTDAPPATTAAPPATTVAPTPVTGATVPPTTAGPASLLTGEFELSAGGTNGYHYVNITKKSGNDYTWTNRAGFSWTITFTSMTTSPTSTSTTLRFSVGPDCPYYNSGYTEGKLVASSDKVIQIEGPGLEFYTKISSAPPTTAGPTTACDLEGTCSLRTYWGDETSLDHLTGSIFVIWWDRKFDHKEDARFLLDLLSNVSRTDCLTNLGMSDPPNPAAGYFFNVYIHHNKDDLFPEGWGNGVGTDPWGVPFFTAPYGSIRGRSMWHEGFHIFQYKANSPGFAYSGDSQWFIESAAQWYMAQQEAVQGDNKLYQEAGAIIGNPQLALWHSFNNQAPQDPNHSDGRPGWMYGVRQYGMHSLLIYLTTVAKIDRAVITDGFYANTNLSPQEYISSRVGPAKFRGFFADWAAHNSAEMDYITRGQYARALQEISIAGDWETFRPGVWTGQDQGTSGWESPPQELAVRGWAYNVWNVTNTQDTKYTFELQGEATGSQGGQAAFEGRVVVMQNDGAARFLPLEMATALQGSVSLDVSALDEQLLFCVVSVPENFGSYQTYGYKAMITRG